MTSPVPLPVPPEPAPAPAPADPGKSPISDGSVGETKKVEKQ